MAAGTITLRQHGAIDTGGTQATNTGGGAGEFIGANLNYVTIDCGAAVNAKLGITSGELSTVPRIVEAISAHATVVVANVPADDTQWVHMIVEGPVNQTAAEYQVTVRALGTVDSVNLSAATVAIRADFRGYHA
jgi:hypothetical protein